MPMLNWDNVPTGFTLIPDGEYKACVDSIDIKFTAAGDEMWKIKWRIIDGEHTGQMVRDNVSFGLKALPRAKLVLKRLGLDLTGEKMITVDDVIGRQCWVTVHTSSYKDKKTDKDVPCNAIKYDGFRSMAAEQKKDSDLPF
jgi:hypothetical protein